jgi:hypothetical protein
LSTIDCVSGEGLPRNWMDVLSHGGYNI